MHYTALFFFIWNVSVTLAARGTSRQQGQQECKLLSQRRQGYLLSIRWPPSFCMNSPDDECSGPPEWVIDSFRAIPYSNQWNEDRGEPAVLQYCCHQEQLNTFRLESIADDLNKYWPPESYTDKYQYWNEQWHRYGSCCHDPTKELSTNERTSSSKYDQIAMSEYFALALDLYHRFPIKKWLSKAQIYPNNNKSYPKRWLEKTLNSHLGNYNEADNRNRRSKLPYRLGCSLWKYDVPISSSSRSNHTSSSFERRMRLWRAIHFCFNEELDLDYCSNYDLSNTIHASYSEHCHEHIFWINK